MSEPLDLRAIEARLKALDSDPQGTLTLAEEKALLAALRETRAMLNTSLVEYARHGFICEEHTDEPCICGYEVFYERTASALSQVVDTPADDEPTRGLGAAAGDLTP